jgi:superfamily I DNA/RNA helicase
MELSKYQKAIYKAFCKTNRNITISAVAGSGKTTVLLGLLQFIPKGKQAIFLAFNNSVVDELQRRNGREDVNIMTIHSCGLRALRNRYGKIKVNPNKVIAKTEQCLKKESNITPSKRGYYFYIVQKIVDLMRCNLCSPNKEDINKMLEHYALIVEDKDIEIAMKVFNLMQKDLRQFDFMDMIYLPVVDKTIRLQKYDYVLCDESQDFSLCQQEFIKRLIARNGRIVTVGDPKQAIYGFAGADDNSYERLSMIAGTSLKMPLSVCYRCASNIVKEAQKIVPYIQYSEDAISGFVEREGTLTDIEDGDWVLCRNLRPLIQTYLWLIKNKIKSKIRGKDIGEGVLNLLNKLGVKNVEDLEGAIDEEYKKLCCKLKERGIRRPEYHPKVELLMQRADVILCLAEDINTIKELRQTIENIFTDEIEGILLSTIHKSKGLENDKIFFLCPELIPSKYAVMDWQYEQEQNLKYVAITRAKKHLVYVNGKQFLEDICSRVFIKRR